MHKVGTSTDGPHAQIKCLKQEMKQKRFRSNFEIKNWNEMKLKLLFKWNRSWNKVQFSINFKIQIEQEREIHFWNKNHSQKQFGPHGSTYTCAGISF